MQHQTSSDTSISRPWKTAPVLGITAVGAIAAFAWTQRVLGHQSVLSYRSAWSVMSASSVLSIGSAASLLSVGSFASILSIGSSNSILSIGSDGGFLSVGRSTRASQR